MPTASAVCTPWCGYQRLMTRASTDPLPRLDQHPELRRQLQAEARLRPGQVWHDPQGRHRVGCLDATNAAQVRRLCGSEKATLAIQDPPYNLAAFETRSVEAYIDWCRLWLHNTLKFLAADSALYIWLGADQRRHFQPLPEFMLLMREFDFESRSLLTMRNQRGYGTQHNWMAVRQELLYYTRGKPFFAVQYTDIPKILRGYYKTVGGRKQENLARSKSETIRAGNVWVDVQQIFYRLEENVSGCYAQKPLQAIERIVQASSQTDDLVLDFFAHSGATLLACERLGRRCYTIDLDPVYAEITIRRLEHYRRTGRTGWQNRNPFAPDEIDTASTAVQSDDQF